MDLHKFKYDCSVAKCEYLVRMKGRPVEHNCRVLSTWILCTRCLRAVLLHCFVIFFFFLHFVVALFLRKNNTIEIYFYFFFARLGRAHYTRWLTSGA